MAVRLTVVMADTPPPGVSAKLAQDIVGGLIGLPEIDLTLVRSLSSADEGSTDRLTLEAISGDVAALDWRSPQQIVTALQAIGFDGLRWPHANDPGAAKARQSPSSQNEVHRRRIYAFDLTDCDSSARLLSAIEELKSQRQVRAFSILPPAGAAPQRPSRSAAQPTAPTAPRSNLPPPSDEDSPPAPATDHGASEIDLDALIDQLDRSET